jgi:hypothetical protein
LPSIVGVEGGLPAVFLFEPVVWRGPDRQHKTSWPEVVERGKRERRRRAGDRKRRAQRDLDRLVAVRFNRGSVPKEYQSHEDNHYDCTATHAGLLSSNRNQFGKIRIRPTLATIAANHQSSIINHQSSIINQKSEIRNQKSEIRNQ